MNGIPVTRRLPLHEMLDQGIEPLPLVLSAAHELPSGGYLEVVAPFLPSPLVEALTGEGFAVRLDRGEGTHWILTVTCG